MTNTFSFRAYTGYKNPFTGAAGFTHSDDRLYDKQSNTYYITVGGARCLVHSDIGPAVIREDGIKIWYKNGKRHREDGPAIECVNGLSKYFLDNQELSVEAWRKILDKQIVKIHYLAADGITMCVDVPKQEYMKRFRRERQSGQYKVFVEGVWYPLHRTDGPAHLKEGSRDKYFIRGVFYRTKAKYEEMMRYYNAAVRMDASTDPVEDTNVGEFYFQNESGETGYGTYNAEKNAPFLIAPNGKNCVDINGKSYCLHNVVGPALITKTNKEWFVNGRRHRLDGPAFVCDIANPSIEHFYIDGKLIKPEQYNDAVYEYKEKISKVNSITYLNKNQERGIVFLTDQELEGSLIHNPPRSGSDSIFCIRVDGEVYTIHSFNDEAAAVYTDGSANWVDNGIIYTNKEAYVLHKKVEAGPAPECQAEPTSTIMFKDDTGKIGRAKYYERCDPQFTSQDGKVYVFYNKSKYLLHNDGDWACDLGHGKQWWFDGKLHRLDGPALIEEDGVEGYFIEGKCIRADLYKAAVQKYLENKEIPPTKSVTENPEKNSGWGMVLAGAFAATVISSMAGRAKAKQLPIQKRAAKKPDEQIVTSPTSVVIRK